MCSAERTRAWLATIELPPEVEAHAKQLARARDRSLRGADPANMHEVVAKHVEKVTVPVQQTKEKRRGLPRWFSCFVGGDVR
jgi:hypothetical protein